MVGAPAPAPALRVRGLAKAYGPRTAVTDVSLDAAAGTITAVLGVNGAGKTTTIECCEGLRAADAGEVRVLGLDPRRDAARLRPRVGVMLQDGGLPAAARVGETLRHVSRMYARPRDPDELAARLGLDGLRRSTVRRLSGGERQRLALALALLGRPEVVFLDEPAAGVDVRGRAAVHALVREERDRGAAVVLTTHQLAEAEALADHVVVIDRGRTVAAGSPAALLAGAGTGPLGGPAGPAGSVGRIAVTRALHVTLDRPVDPADLSAALRARVSAADASPGQGASRPAARLRIEPDGAVDPALVAALAAWCAARGVLLTGLDAGRGGLEDAFLALTQGPDR